MKPMNGKWAVAVSGGPDSMALLGMCLENHMDILAVHVNYHHRKEADEEEQYVRSFCQEHGIPCVVQNQPFVSQGNFEADARTWRYDFFWKIVEKYHLDGVLTAHQEDDLLETYYMQKERNLVPSWYGLKAENNWHGMRVLRPLLSYTKKDLQEYCVGHGIRYYVDATNFDETITRNRIRHQTVEKMSRPERDAVLQEIDEKNKAKTKREEKADALLQNGRVSLKDYRKLAAEERGTLLRRCVEKQEDPHHSLAWIRETDAILMKKNDFMIPLGHENLVSDHACFFLQKPYASYEDVYHSLAEMQNVQKERYRIAEGRQGIYACSVRKEDFPLTIRSFHTGDAITMRYGKKSVHRFFIDRHIPLYLRASWPVVCNAQGEVILVPGLGCDPAHYTVAPDFNVIEYREPEGD